MGVGPWVRPPDRVVPVPYNSLRVLAWTTSTALGSDNPYLNPGEHAWENLTLPDAPPNIGVGQVDFTQFTMTGRRWRPVDEAPTQGYAFRRPVMWVSATADFPQVPPGHVPPGGVVEYDDDGMYLGTPSASFVCSLIAPLTGNPSVVGDPTIGAPVTGHLRRLPTFDSRSTDALGPADMPTSGQAGPVVATGSTVVGNPGSPVQFGGASPLPFDTPHAYVLTSTWESAIPSPDAPPPPSFSATTRLLQASVSAVVAEVTCLYRPPRYRIITPARGAWRLRQRQSLTGTDSWPLRQRQNGGASGAWPLRQRQRGA